MEPQDIATHAAEATPPKLVQLGGYMYNFVNPVPKHLVCIVCNRPGRDTRYSGCCLMTCCSSCLYDAIDKKAPCPHCPNNEISVSTATCQFSRDEEINSLDVYCINKGRGCGWQGRLDSIDDHIAVGNTDGCQFHEFQCPYNCGKILQRRYMIAHQRECPYYEIDCQYCHIREKRCFINGEHKDKCSKFPLTCPNKCAIGRVLREDMKNHRNQCPLEVIRCVYQNVGCTAVMLRRDLDKHCNENLIEHLKLKLDGTKAELDGTKAELVGAKAELGNAVNKITELETIILRTNTALGMAIISSVLAWPKKLVAMGTICESNILMCPVILKMSEFAKKKQEEVEWFSPSFYSHNQGYKFCLNVDANGYSNSKGTHMSVWLCLTKGPYDDWLPWPLRERFEIQVLNQIKDRWHHALIVIYGDELPDDYAGRITGNNKANVVGEASFISHEDLCNGNPKCQFLKDDCVYFKITKQ